VPLIARHGVSKRLHTPKQHRASLRRRHGRLGRFQKDCGYDCLKIFGGNLCGAKMLELATGVSHCNSLCEVAEVFSRFLVHRLRDALGILLCKRAPYLFLLLFYFCICLCFCICFCLCDGTVTFTNFVTLVT
jgi:hypothetical protein